ncbi:hypothetical protein GY21_20595 [Cryobacterium roopkundense]|uniref:Uncharacterized protein n=2 Tax=Cryobacterium roopkundense TaxID=1001240 RepID=A0A099IZT7_9MICO|nr:hypothetical protein GY21_20595 [Cryobacterium roopkundense]
MNAVNWKAVTPILILGGLIAWLVVWNSADASNPLLPWVVLGVPTVGVLTLVMSVLASLRRRKSSRTWELMLRDDPDSAHFIAFVYPAVKAQLGRLGWRLHKSAYFSIPTIGVGIDSTSVTFWEAGMMGPTLTLAGSEIASVTVAPVSDGYRNHPAIQLRLNTSNRSKVLDLNLRDVRHRNLSSAELSEARDRIPLMR